MSDCVARLSECPKELEDLDIEGGSLGEHRVTMSNPLARAADRLDLFEKRLIAIGIAKTNTYPGKFATITLHKKQGWDMVVTAQEYAEQFGITTKVAYAQLAAASKKLFERKIAIVTKRDRNKAPIDVMDARWVSSAHYVKSQGHVVLSFTKEIAPHLLGLAKQFTMYQLKHVAGLDTAYAWSLYRVLKSEESRGYWKPKIEEFAEVMETPDSYLADFKAMRTRVIEPAVVSICAKSDLHVQWKPVRYGARKVSALEFRFVFGQVGSASD